MRKTHHSVAAHAALTLGRGSCLPHPACPAHGPSHQRPGRSPPPPTLRTPPASPWGSSLSRICRPAFQKGTRCCAETSPESHIIFPAGQNQGEGGRWVVSKMIPDQRETEDTSSASTSSEFTIGQLCGRQGRAGTGSQGPTGCCCRLYPCPSSSGSSAGQAARSREPSQGPVLWHSGLSFHLQNQHPI